MRTAPAEDCDWRRVAHQRLCLESIRLDDGDLGPVKTYVVQQLPLGVDLVLGVP